MVEEINIDYRTYRGERCKSMYHEECDDGHAFGSGHMRVIQRENCWYYKCKSCGYKLPYEDYDTSPHL